MNDQNKLENILQDKHLHSLNRHIACNGGASHRHLSIQTLSPGTLVGLAKLMRKLHNTWPEG